MLRQEELWRHIPPEEKFRQMAKAHSKGLMAATSTVLLGSAIAVGFQVVAALWISILLCPLAFQVASHTAWRAIRPRVMLEYLAARSAARRYAYLLNARELDVIQIFKANLQRQFENKEQELEDAVLAIEKEAFNAEVWVALLSDCLVIMSEEPGGAKLEFGNLLTASLQIDSPADTDYTKDKEVFLSHQEKSGSLTKFRITSECPAALVVFEKRLRSLRKVNIDKLKQMQTVLSEIAN